MMNPCNALFPHRGVDLRMPLSDAGDMRGRMMNCSLLPLCRRALEGQDQTCKSIFVWASQLTRS
jgi:hypothetical protein